MCIRDSKWSLAVRCRGGSTDLAAAIRVIRTQMYTGARAGSQRVAVIMVEGPSINEADAVQVLAHQTTLWPIYTARRCRDVTPLSRPVESGVVNGIR